MARKLKRGPPKSFKRRKAIRSPQWRFIIYCEGENTEPAYFDALSKLLGSEQIFIETKAAAGVPYTIAESAVAHARELGLAKRTRKKLDSFEERDEVWAVFDRDEHPRFTDAVKFCKINGIGVARSNPCFEVWLILHVEPFDSPDGRHDVQKHFARLCDSYNPTGRKIPNCERLIKNIERAEELADAQIRNRAAEGDPYGPPSTTVFELTRKIRIAARRADS